MIEGMAPSLRPESFVFVTGAAEAMISGAIAMLREDEGLSLIVPAEGAPPDLPRMRMITLQVHSALEGVGLTAAVAAALAEHDIAANVVAAYHHDHVFVPETQADAALAVLRALAAAAAG